MPTTLNRTMKLAEPTTTAAGAGLAVKLGSLAGAGAIAAALMWLVSKDQMTRKEVLARGFCSIVGSLLGGGWCARWVDSKFDFYNLADLSGLDFMEMVIPVYLIVGALSWGFFGALEFVGRHGGKAAGERIVGWLRGTDAGGPNAGGE